jgi:hypothetical protein
VNIIYEKAGEVHVYTGYYTNGVLVLKFQERSLSMLHQKKKRKNSSKKDEGDNLSHT